MTEAINKTTTVHQPNAKLTKYIRVIVYSYLDFGKVFYGARSLSKQERQTIDKTAAIARKGKQMRLRLDQFLKKDECILHDGKLQKVLEKLETALSMTDKIIITDQKVNRDKAPTSVCWRKVLRKSI